MDHVIKNLGIAAQRWQKTPESAKTEFSDEATKQFMALEPIFRMNHDYAPDKAYKTALAAAKRLSAKECQALADLSASALRTEDARLNRGYEDIGLAFQQIAREKELQAQASTGELGLEEAAKSVSSKNLREVNNALLAVQEKRAALEQQRSTKKLKLQLKAACELESRLLARSEELNRAPKIPKAKLLSEKQRLDLVLQRGPFEPHQYAEQLAALERLEKEWEVALPSLERACKRTPLTPKSPAAVQQLHHQHAQLHYLLPMLRARQAILRFEQALGQHGWESAQAKAALKELDKQRAALESLKSLFHKPADRMTQNLRLSNLVRELETLPFEEPPAGEYAQLYLQTPSTQIFCTQVHPKTGKYVALAGTYYVYERRHEGTIHNLKIIQAGKAPYSKNPRIEWNRKTAQSIWQQVADIWQALWK